MDLTSYAQCRAAKKAKGKGKKPRITESSANVPLLSGFLALGDDLDARAVARGGRLARSAAAAGLSPAPFAGTTAIDFAFPFESRRTSAKGWTISAVYFSPLSRTLTAFAYCASGKPPKERSATAFLAGNPLSTAALDSPPCQPRRRLVSGGFLSTVPSPTGGWGTFHASAPSGASWHSLAAQSGSGSGGTVTADGYCL